MNLLDSYLIHIKTYNYHEDKIQLKAIDFLQEIIDKVNNERGTYSIWFILKQKIFSIRGLYMWGGVGRGKTFLMDLFYEQLNTPYKLRIHFNRFMKDIHSLLRKFQGLKNPLYKASKTISKKYRIICFDEFFIEDVADAMILGKLIMQLFALGTVLVITSNTPPEKLYLGGLQRTNFLPAINDLLKKVNVLNIDSGIDYRTSNNINTFKKYKNYLYPLPRATIQLGNYFKKNTSKNVIYNTCITLEERIIQVNAIDKDSSSIWFDFNHICGNERNSTDYIAMANYFNNIYISNVPILGIDLESETKRFITMIDEFYDQKINFVISANGSPNKIYQGERLKFEFKRTASRLLCQNSAV